MNVRIQIRAIGLLCCLLLTHWAFSQTTRYVSTTGITPAASATSWAASTTSLQGAIDYVAANGGGQVWVAAGVYKPTTTTGPDSRTISFSMKNGVAIYGGFAGNETNISQRPAINPVSGNPSGSTLSGEIGDPASTTDNSYHVISNSAGLTNSSLLDGFVITGSNANGDLFPQNFGGGVFNRSESMQVCSPGFRNCLFTGNSASAGGAMYNYGVSGQASPVLTNCVLQSNSATQGGAIYSQSASGQANPVLTNCVLQSNSAAQGGAMLNNGVGGQASPMLINCTLRGNSASQQGGAMYNFGGGGCGKAGAYQLCRVEQWR